jgi:hypothetical protein
MLDYSNPSMDRSMKIHGQLQQVFKPYSTILKKFKEKKKQLPSQCFCKGKKNTKKY